jgi:dTMP kinase
MTQRGKFITFEGVEGSGKTTQIHRLALFLESQGVQLIESKEPGGTRIGRHIRKILLNADHTEMVAPCETLLYLADRAQHVHEVILPSLEKGTWILADRYHDSTLAYQGVGRGIGHEIIDPIYQLATGGLKPDLTILLDLSAEVGLARAQHRNIAEEMALLEGRFEAEQIDFHCKIRQHFLDMAAAEPERYAIISADQTVDEVEAAVQEVLKTRLESAFV